MLMSKSAYARHCGVSRQAVYDWVARGEVVMSGSKIDVEATEQKRQGEKATNDDEFLTLSASQLIEWLYVHNGKYPAAESQDEARKLIQAAANTIVHDVEFLSDDGEEAVRIYCDEKEHFFIGFNQMENSMHFIRDALYAECLIIKLRGHGDDIDPEVDSWPLCGLIALCTPLETEEARIRRWNGKV